MHPQKPAVYFTGGEVLDTAAKINDAIDRGFTVSAMVGGVRTRIRAVQKILDRGVASVVVGTVLAPRFTSVTTDSMRANLDAFSCLEEVLAHLFFTSQITSARRSALLSLVQSGAPAIALAQIRQRFEIETVEIAGHPEAGFYRLGKRRMAPAVPVAAPTCAAL